MQPVEVGPGAACAVEPEEFAWNRVVDEHIELVWSVSRRVGLDEDEAAVVSQLTWLRLAERWPALYPRLMADADAAVRATWADLQDWIGATAQTEAEALVAQHVRVREVRARQVANVICLSPGFQLPAQRVRRH